jgi:stage II sporulation protein D
MHRKFEKAPEIEVGIITSGEIVFTLEIDFSGNKGVKIHSGKWTARKSNNKILIKGEGSEYFLDSGTILIPGRPEKNSFTVHSVTIGVNFHWQRNEDQVFIGKLKLLLEGDMITLVNVISIEDYLVSVISSEMKATSSIELLKAHAVVSRGWLIAQIEKRKYEITGKKYDSYTRTDDEIVRWYDREDHINFDVCADDHCQRYQGVTRASTAVVKNAVSETSGEVMTYAGQICDTRYSKCCGGVTELFENAWEPVHHNYLQRVEDCAFPVYGDYPDLTSEANSRSWIEGNPDAFCNTNDKAILSQVLNDYDQETNDFFRWKIKYPQKELSELIRTRTGIDFGTVTDLIPTERGVSGRIIRLKIVGSLKTMIIGKELEIRKALSKSHLYSSCFVVDKVVEGNDTVFNLKGAGWGHGVGLCQIGAAVMGAEGYSYREILSHYFRGGEVERLY